MSLRGGSLHPMEVSFSIITEARTFTALIWRATDLLHKVWNTETSFSAPTRTCQVQPEGRCCWWWGATGLHVWYTYKSSRSLCLLPAEWPVMRKQVLFCEYTVGKVEYREQIWFHSPGLQCLHGGDRLFWGSPCPHRWNTPTANRAQWRFLFRHLRFLHSVWNFQ